MILWQRFEALKQLGLLGDYETLLQTLQEKDINVHMQSGAALARCGPAAFPAMVALLASSADRDVKRSLLYCFGHMGFWPPQGLDFLQDPDPYTRSAAVYALSKTLRDVEVLREMSGDPDAGVRRSVAAALGEEAFPMCHDPDPRVREEAVRHTRSLSLLLDVLQSDPDPEVKLRAVKSLRQVGRPEALELLDWFESKIRLWWKSRKERRTAERALRFSRGQIRLSVNQQGTDSVTDDALHSNSP